MGKKGPVSSKEMSKICKAATNGMAIVDISKKFRRRQSTVEAIIENGKKLNTALALTKKDSVEATNAALRKSNNSVLTVSLGNLCDILAKNVDDIGEIEMVQVCPKTRECRVRIAKDLAFSV